VNKPLDSFESALLLELRQHVAEHPAPEPVPGRRPRRRLRLAAIGATGVAASVVAVFGLGSGGGSPAYAVDENSDGDVIVTVHRLDDAAGLEKALADKGIDADVSYDPNTAVNGNTFTMTLPDGLAEAPEGGGQTGSGGGPTLSQGGGQGTGPKTSHGPDGSRDDACDLGDSQGPPATLAHEGEDWVLRIPAGSPLMEDREVAIRTTVDGMLSVLFTGDKPGSYCGLASMGSPAP
jgi:hypothetical protein